MVRKNSSIQKSKVESKQIEMKIKWLVAKKWSQKETTGNENYQQLFEIKQMFITAMETNENLRICI